MIETGTVPTGSSPLVIREYKKFNDYKEINWIETTEKYLFYSILRPLFQQFDRQTGDWIRNISMAGYVKCVVAFQDPASGQEYVLAIDDQRPRVFMFNSDTGDLVRSFPINHVGNFHVMKIKNNELWVVQSPTSFRIFHNLMDETDFTDLTLDYQGASGIITFELFSDWVIVADWDQRVNMFHAKNGTLALSLYDSAAPVWVNTLTIHDNGYFAYLFIVADDYYLERWALSTQLNENGEMVPSAERRFVVEPCISAKTPLITSLAVYENRFVVVAGTNCPVTALNFGTGEPLRTYYTDLISFVKISGTSVFLANTAEVVKEMFVGDCEPGYEALNSPLCTECLSGTFKSTRSPEVCEPCPANTACNIYSWECKAGFYWSNDKCIQCPAGTYKSNAGNEVFYCKTCPANAVCTSTDYVCTSGYELDSKKTCCPQNADCTANDFVCRTGYKKTQQGNLCEAVLLKEPQEPAPVSNSGTTAGIVVGLVAAAGIACSVWWWKFKTPAATGNPQGGSMANSQPGSNQTPTQMTNQTTVTIPESPTATTRL